MSDPYFTIFKELRDHTEWSKQIEYAYAMEDIDEKLRTEFVLSLKFLQNEFGNDFLKSSSLIHPIQRKISNKVDWQILQLIQFTSTLRTLKATASNYQKLKRKLYALEESKTEGIPFVEIAESYLKENLMVNFPDESNIDKSPDIEITNLNNKEKFFIEVSMIRESAERTFKKNNYNFLFYQFHFLPPRYPYTGKQKSKIRNQDYTRLERIISTAKNQVHEQQEIVSYSDDQIEFTIVPNEKINELDKICKLNGTRRNDVRGLDLNFDETDRLISNKIKRKVKQIPFNSNGIIYFPVTPMFFMFSHLEDSVSRIAEYISRFSHLIGIVLYSVGAINPQEEKFMEFENHIYSCKMTGGVFCREVIFVSNSQCKLMIQEETVAKIYGSFR